ncbi:MAG TPA: outer membrane protein assembly factor BamD [Chthoniobacterales bacterium]|nr:outer membrane protein assembly factor BamD [Chthoniobacterales bacterium]
MHRPFYTLVLVASCFAFAQLSPAAVVFRPGEKAKYVAPGDEEMSGNAQELWQNAQAAENAGDLGRATKAYRAIVKRHPKDTLAPGAAFRFAQLEERTADYLKAAAAYRVLVEQYPKSPHFNEAIEAQFRIGEMYLAGKKLKLLGIPIRTSVDRSVEIFAAIVRTAPYGKYTARAQFNIGLAAEKMGNAEQAVQAYQAVVENFPNDPVAADAQYQIGYLWFNALRTGTKDARATANARTGFQDFLNRYPKSEKAVQARENLRALDQKQTSNSFQIAKFYDKQKNYKAAVIYYNDVIRQQPGSRESDRAKQRVDELRAKVGDAALQPPELTAATAKKPKKPLTSGTSRGGAPDDEGPAPDDVAPLPPPEADESLPPPASTPDTTTAPDTSGSGDSSSSD